jgi:hypothetical protein
LYATTEGLTWLVAGWTPDAIEKLVARGIFKLNEHYVQPFGEQRLFIVRNVEAAIEKGLVAPAANVVEARSPLASVETKPAGTAIPMGKGRVIDVEKAQEAAAQRLRS